MFLVHMYYYVFLSLIMQTKHPRPKEQMADSAFRLSCVSINTNQTQPMLPALECDTTATKTVTTYAWPTILRLYFRTMSHSS